MVTSCRIYWYFYSLLLLLLLLLSLSSESSQWILIGVKAQQPLVLTIHVHHSRTYHDGSKSDNQFSNITNDIPQSIIPNVTIQFESAMLQTIDDKKGTTNDGSIYDQQETNETTNESFDIFDVSYIEFILHDNIQSKSSSILSATTTRSHIFFKSTASYRNKKSSVIDIEDTTTIKNETVWFGSTITSSYDNNSSDNNSIMGFCSLYSLGGIIQSGTFTTDDATYDLIYLLTNQSYIISSTLLADYPPHEINDDDDYLNKTNLFDNNSANYAFDEASRIQYPSLVSINPNENEIVNDWIDVQGPAAMIYNPTVVSGVINPSKSKSSSSNVVVDVLVIVTNRALCEYAGYYINHTRSTTPSYPYCSVTVENYTPIQNKIYQVIAETNNAMRYVNVEIRLKLIQYLIDDGSQNLVNGYDPVADAGGIQSVRDNWFIQLSRIDQRADLVAIIAGAGGNCGIAINGGYMSLTNHRCLSAYSFSHEIGHNLGCNHNRESCPSTKSHPYAYAYRDLVNRAYSTMVAYGCGSGEKQCPRIPYYSSSIIILPDGRKLGDELNDNLRVIGANAPRVASYQMGTPVPPPPSPTIIVIKPPQPTVIVTKPPVDTCFSSINTVVVKDIGDIPLSELKIGDFVKTHHDDERYTQVYGFGHYDHEREELFLRMTFDSNHDFVMVDINSKNSNNNHHNDLSIEKYHYTNDVATTNPRYLEISPNHLIFVKRNDQQQTPIRALDVVVGDQISDGRQIVTSIERIKRRGVYAPLTQSGDILVSGVHVSNFVNLFDIVSNNNNNVNSGNSSNMIVILNQHMIGHILFTPQRLFCQYYIETCKKEYYITGYGLSAYMIISCANIIKYMIDYTNNIINMI